MHKNYMQAVQRPRWSSAMSARILVAGAALLVTTVLSAEPAARLTVLVDNSVARPGVKAEWGFACLVEAHGHTVLLDTGPNPEVLKDNLAALNVAPAGIEAVVISHYHGDHTLGASGLAVGKGVRVYTPHSFDRHKKEAAALDAAGLVRVPVTAMTEIFDGITVSEPLRFGGAIPQGKPGADSKNEQWEWEHCLVVDTPPGLVVVVGCSHPGILAMLEQVKKESGRPIYLVLGGFHLGNASSAKVRTIATSMKAMGVARVGATHCTGEVAKAVFREVFGDRFVDGGVGSVIEVAAPVPENHAN
jgi:7,8-dihydropterin-6-yl-methyl-4-(beta-D-ribofuranosyl)aminobenzene 5'-phosphate synthase